MQKKQLWLFILVFFLVVTISACSRPNGELVGTWEHYATVVDDVSHEALGMFSTFNADGTGRIWHPEAEDYNTFEWETTSGELFIETAIPAGWVQEENPIPDDILQRMLEGLSTSFLYEISGDTLILSRHYLTHMNVYEVYIRID